MARSATFSLQSYPCLGKILDLHLPLVKITKYDISVGEKRELGTKQWRKSAHYVSVWVMNGFMSHAEGDIFVVNWTKKILFTTKKCNIWQKSPDGFKTKQIDKCYIFQWQIGHFLLFLVFSSIKYKKITYSIDILLQKHKFSWVKIYISLIFSYDHYSNNDSNLKP